LTLVQLRLILQAQHTASTAVKLLQFSYTLSSGETQTESAAQTGTVSTGMGNMGGPGGQKPDGAPPSGGGGGPKPDDDTPRSKPTGEMPQKDSGNAKA